MHLVEILLPLNDNSGRPFGAEKYAAIRPHLTSILRQAGQFRATAVAEPKPRAAS